MNISLLHRYRYLRLNGLWLSPSEIPQRLSTHVDDLLSLDSLHCTSRVGTCVLLKVNNRFFGTCTQHQLIGRDPQWIGVNISDDRTVQTSGGYLTVQNDDELIGDLALFDFTEAVSEDGLRADRFFSLNGESIVANGDDVIGMVAFGYLDSDQRLTVEYEERLPLGYQTTALHQVLRPLSCIYAGVGSDPTAFRFEIVDEVSGSYSGLSGGPIFAVVREKPLSFCLKFAGIVTHASAGLGWGIKADSIFSRISLREWA